MFVGHSLGGGLASAVAGATGLNAVTFNSAGLSSRYRGNPGSITSYYARSDLLNNFQDLLLLLPNARGTRVGLSPNGMHQMSGVCKSMAAKC